MPQFNEDIYLGPAWAPNMQEATDTVGASPMDVGVGPMGRVYIFDVVPATKSTTAVAAAQAVADAGNLTINGTKASGGIATLDTPRAVDIVSSDAGDTTQTATVTGTDIYGKAMTEDIAFNGTTRVAGKKAFKTVTQVAIDAALAGNGSCGSTDVLGLPVCIPDTGYVSAVKWNDTLAADAGTFVKADTTDPATSTTGDVRGTYTPSSACDGSKRLVMALAMRGLSVGPNATRAGAFGVTQA